MITVSLSEGAGVFFFDDLHEIIRTAVLNIKNSCFIPGIENIKKQKNP